MTTKNTKATLQEINDGVYRYRIGFGQSFLIQKRDNGKGVDVFLRSESGRRYLHQGVLPSIKKAVEAIDSKQFKKVARQRRRSS